MACYSGSSIPAAFSTRRSSPRGHGIRSEYEPQFVMHDSGPFTSGSRELSDDEAYPVMTKPQPQPQPSLTGSGAGAWGGVHPSQQDPLLCVTPEKSRGPYQTHHQRGSHHQGSHHGGSRRQGSHHQGSHAQGSHPQGSYHQGSHHPESRHQGSLHHVESLKRGSDEGILSDRPENSQKVRFDTTVEVKHMSPETSTEASTLDTTPSPLQGPAPHPASIRGGSSWRQDPGELDPDSDDSEVQFYNSGTPPDVLASGGDAGEATGGSSRDASAECGSRDQSPIAVVAKDFMATAGDGGHTAGASRQPASSAATRRRHEAITRASRQVAKQRAELAEPLGITGSDVIEHSLARPEFNSTLRVRREIQELEEKDVDLVAAVQHKLSLSHKLRNHIEEKASAKLNAGSAQFTDLISVDVPGEEVLRRAARQKTAKVKPAPKVIKPEHEEVSAPDLMELFTADLQKETASYSLEGLPPLRPQLRTADPHRAFDVYRHVRTWQGY